MKPAATKTGEGMASFRKTEQDIDLGASMRNVEGPTVSSYQPVVTRGLDRAKTKLGQVTGLRARVFSILGPSPSQSYGRGGPAIPCSQKSPRRVRWARDAQTGTRAPEGKHPQLAEGLQGMPSVLLRQGRVSADKQRAAHC